MVDRIIQRRSVSDADFVAENRAGRELLRGLRDSLTGDLHAGVAVWAVDGVSRRDLTSIANATDVDQMEDVARLPYCAAVPPPYSEQAETYSNYFCVGDPSATRSSNEFELAGVDVAANMSSNAGRPSKTRTTPTTCATTPRKSGASPRARTTPKPY